MNRDTFVEVLRAFVDHWQKKAVELDPENEAHLKKHFEFEMLIEKTQFFLKNEFGVD